MEESLAREHFQLEFERASARSKNDKGENEWEKTPW